MPDPLGVPLALGDADWVPDGDPDRLRLIVAEAVPLTEGVPDGLRDCVKVCDLVLDAVSVGVCD